MNVKHLGTNENCYYNCNPIVATVQQHCSDKLCSMLLHEVVIVFWW